MKRQAIQHRCLSLLLCNVFFMVRPLPHYGQLISWQDSRWQSEPHDTTHISDWLFTAHGRPVHLHHYHHHIQNHHDHHLMMKRTRMTTTKITLMRTLLLHSLLYSDHFSGPDEHNPSEDSCPSLSATRAVTQECRFFIPS